MKRKRLPAVEVTEESHDWRAEVGVDEPAKAHPEKLRRGRRRGDTAAGGLPEMRASPPP